MLGVLAFVAGTLPSRLPYWGEAEVVFEAARIRSGFPLFTDPLVGAAEAGLPPSRYYVTYPPILSSLLALVPVKSALVVGRLLSAGAWFGTLGWIAKTGRFRANAVACAAYVGGLWLIANFAMVARPDSVACALGAVGLTRAIRRGRIGTLEAALLVLASAVKPTVVGLPVGAFVADAVARRTWRTLVVGASIAAAVAFGLFWASGGRAFDHVIRSNAQPFAWPAFLAQFTRLPFFAPLFVLGLTVRRADAGARIGLGALAGGIGWTLLAIAKIGSSSNYWMEPSIAAVALVANAPSAYAFGRSGFVHAFVTVGAVLYADVASIPTSIDRIGRYARDAAFVAKARERCVRAPGDVVASDDQGVELAINGRILAPAYQMSWLVATGRFPVDLWVADVASPNVRCYVVQTNALYFVPALRQLVETNFSFAESSDDLRLFVRR